MKHSRFLKTRTSNEPRTEAQTAAAWPCMDLMTLGRWPRFREHNWGDAPETLRLQAKAALEQLEAGWMEPMELWESKAKAPGSLRSWLRLREHAKMWLSHCLVCFRNLSGEESASADGCELQLILFLVWTSTHLVVATVTGHSSCCVTHVRRAGRRSLLKGPWTFGRLGLSEKQFSFWAAELYWRSLEACADEDLWNVPTAHFWNSWRQEGFWDTPHGPKVLQYFYKVRWEGARAARSKASRSIYSLVNSHLLWFGQREVYPFSCFSLVAWCFGHKLIIS